MAEESGKTERTASLEREDFLAVLNHRLRIPILAIVRALNLVIQGEFGQLSPAQDEIIKLIQANAGELDRLLSMLSDIYRYKNNRKSLNLEQIDLGDLVLSVSSQISTGSAREGVHIVSNAQTCQILIKADRQEIATLVKHLLDNAMKHARTFVEITTEVDNASKCASLIIRDDGKGIKKEDRANLFDRFYTVSTDRRYAPVTGTGLCLCAEICKAHGGTIQCESEYGASTTFTVRIPLAEKTS